MTWPVSISATPSGTGNLGGTTPKHTELHTEIKNAIDNIVTEVNTKAVSSGGNTLTGAQKVQAAANQDAIELVGRSGGTSGFKVSVTPLALSANRTISLPDETGTVALRWANTFTGKQTIDLGSGSGGILVGTALALKGADTANLNASAETYGNGNGFVFYAYNIGGTLASQTATLNSSAFISFGCRGHDGSSVTGTKGLFGAESGGNWSGSSTPLRWRWKGCKTNSTTIEDFMVLDEGILKIPLTTDATDKDTGSIVTEGGIGVEKSIFAGGPSCTVAGQVRMHYDSGTGERGMQVKISNRTGETSVKGKLVHPSSSNDNAVELVSASAPYTPCGVIYEAGIANGSDMWVWMPGSVVEFLMENSDATNRQDWLRASATTNGRVQSAAVPTPPNSDSHFTECGHALESNAGGTDQLVLGFFHVL